MITRFKLSSVLLLLSTFVLHAKTETVFIPGSDAEEEEERKAFPGNESLSTSPPDEDASFRPILEDSVELKRENTWWDSDSNTTDYDEFQEKKENEPENSIDRDLENVNAFLPDPQPDTDISSDFKRKTSSQAKTFLLTYEPPTTTIPDLDFTSSSVTSGCSFGDRNCALLDEAMVASKPVDLHKKLIFTTTSFGDVVKSMKLENDTSTYTSLLPTSIQEIAGMTVSLSPSESTAQTSDNLILLEDVRKDEPALQFDKSEKAGSMDKGTMRDEVLAKTTEMTPLIKVEKETLPSSSPLIASTVATNFSANAKSMQSSSIVSDNLHNTYLFPPILSKDLEPTPIKSSVSSTSSPTVSWHLKSPEDEGSLILQTVPNLTPSFSESPTFSEIFEHIQSTFSKVPQESSTIVSKTSVLSPIWKSQFNPTISDKESTTRIVAIPPPRLTNPSCSSLPVCVEITLLETSWEQFCVNKQDFQVFLSKAVSHYTRPIHPYHIVLDTDICSLTFRTLQSTPDVVVAFYVTNDSGEYEERMTEICGVILRKWAPSTFKDSIMEVRLYNSESVSTPAIPELNSGFVAAVSISAVAGVALCLLCILLVIMKQKLMQGRSSEATVPGADAYSLDSLSISFRRRMRRSARSYLNHAFNDQEIPSHPLNEKTLSNCLKNKELLQEEFKRIPMVMPKLDSIPDGAHVKNRYSNILPKPESRVVLADPSGDPLKCYINANYVKCYEGKSYIACQAPLPEGIEDFWRMVWEQQCRLIVMLTMFEENGTARCAVYFPQSTLVSQQPYGDFQVSLLKKDVFEFYTLSSLRLLDLEKNLFRDIAHLWFTGWPAVGVPKDASTLVTFVQQCRPFINCNSGPTLVHCSTGTGRTGVFLALDICMREYDESRSVDILQCVSQLRRDRAGAVQNKDQYFLIHEAMLEYISRNQAQRPSISN